MELKAVKKGSIIIGIVFIVLSCIELFSAALLWDFITKINLSLPLSGILTCYFLIAIICFFLIIGMVLIIIVSRKSIEHRILAKNVFIIGILILILSFVKLEFITLLGRAEISFSGETFQSIIYNTKSVPFYVLVIWFFFTASDCFYLMIGLLLAASGLHWIIELRDQKKTDA